jgi:TolB-like protein
MFLGEESLKPIRSESTVPDVTERVPNGFSERPAAEAGKMVHIELDRLLGSRELRGSKALADLLRYCVEQTLANNPQQLKEYWIGVNVFRRGDDFDPAADPIVRVQARRLRHKLEAHYRLNASHALTIALRKGAYLTEFHVTPAENPANGSSTAITPIASIAVLPIADLNSDPENRTFCEGLMDELIHALAESGDLMVVARTSLLQYRNTLIDIRDIGHQLGADAIIEGSVVREASRRRVSIRLIDARTGYALLSWQADAESGEAITAQESLAHAFASNMKRLVAARRSKFDG